MNKYYNAKLLQFTTILILSSLCIVLNYLTKFNLTSQTLPANIPQYNVNGINAVVYNKNGKLTYSFLATSGVSYTNNNKLYLTNLDFKSYFESSNLVEYHLTSDDGWVNRDKVGFLGKNAQLFVFSNPQNTTYISGTNIDIDLNANTIKSKDKVLIQNNNKLEGTGFIYNIKTGFLQLLSNIQINYNYENK